MSWDRYLSDVLGVREVVWPATATANTADAAQAGILTSTMAVKILFLAEHTLTPVLDMEIFQRMLQAMKLQETEYAVWELSAVDLATREPEVSPDAVLVSFSKKLTSTWAAQRPRQVLIQTYHPAECEREPKLKRQVWDDLKLALEKAGLSARLTS